MLSEVKFRCGHTGFMNLTGQIEDRTKKIEWYAKHTICPDCRMAAALHRMDDHSRPHTPLAAVTIGMHD